MVIATKNIVKKCCVFEVTCFPIHAILLQAACKVIIKNFRSYFKVVAESKQELFYLHYHSLCDLRSNARATDKTTTKIGRTTFCNLRIFLCAYVIARVPYFTVIAFKNLGFSNLSTFHIETICSLKFWRIVSIGN